MSIVGLDHLVVNTNDVETAVNFYRDVLGLEILRLEEFREGKVGFVSARISAETIIDIRPDTSGDKPTPNLDHYCLVLGATDMEILHAELKGRGVRVEEEVRPAWGTKANLLVGSVCMAWAPVAVSSHSMGGPPTDPSLAMGCTAAWAPW